MIIFAWSGFPQYAARCVGAFVKSYGGDVRVVATRPKVPIKGMENLAGCPVDWIEDTSIEYPYSFDAETILFVGGWSVKAFNALRDKVRLAGGKVILMNDANLIFSIKEILRSIRFRFKFKRLYDGVFVPGKSGRALARFYGMPDTKIVEGLYTADERLFSPGKPLERRDKTIVYVGQFCDRKNVLNLAEAFKRSNIAREGWKLRMYGCGPQKEELVKYADSGVEVHDFIQPELLCALYRRARVFALASKEEHWGLVVHEAALSGCYLLLSNRVGAADDMLGNSNGSIFSPSSLLSITRAIKHISELGDDDWSRAYKESIKKASARGLSLFVRGVYEFCS